MINNHGYAIALCIQHYSSVGGQAEKSTNSEDTYYYTQQEYYQQAEPIQVEPYKSSWSQYASYYEAPNEQVSQIEEPVSIHHRTFVLQMPALSNATA